MSHINKINDALDFIEENITGEMDLNQLANCAGCSAYHFLRTFSFLTEISLSEYIRRRKLTLAVFDLRAGARVITVALKYGYSSPESFSRAFKSMHGVSPKDAVETEAPLNAYPKLSFDLTINGDEKIGYRVIRRQAHQVCGIAIDVPIAEGVTNDMITGFWQDNIDNGALGRLHNDIGLPFETPLNAALYNQRPSFFSYMICHEISDVPSGYAALSLPPLTWAVFSTPEHDSRDNTHHIRNVRERIFMEWFPTSGYTHSGHPEFEIFRGGNVRTVTDIWIPIAKM